MEFGGIVGEESLHVVEVPDSIWIGIRKHVEQHAFDGSTESYGMGAFREEGVIIDLNRIPMVKIGRAASNSSCKVTEAADKNLGRLATRKCSASNTQIGPGCVGIDRFQALVIVHCFVVATNTNRVCEPRREDVSFLDRKKLSRGQRVELNVV